MCTFQSLLVHHIRTVFTLTVAASCHCQEQMCLAERPAIASLYSSGPHHGGPVLCHEDQISDQVQTGGRVRQTTQEYLCSPGPFFYMYHVWPTCTFLRFWFWCYDASSHILWVAGQQASCVRGLFWGLGMADGQLTSPQCCVSSAHQELSGVVAKAGAAAAKQVY
jgi:hypothetical protein